MTVLRPRQPPARGRNDAVCTVNPRVLLAPQDREHEKPGHVGKLEDDQDNGDREDDPKCAMPIRIGMDAEQQSRDEVDH